MNEDIEPEIRPHYWLLFIRSKTFWEKFFYGDFSHISILKNDGFNWIFIDPRPYCAAVEILPFMGEEDINKIFDYFNTDLKGIKVYVKDSIRSKKFKPLRVFIPRIINCVRATKYVLGIKTDGIFPIDFYNQLVRVYKKEEVNTGFIVELIQEYRSK